MMFAYQLLSFGSFAEGRAEISWKTLHFRLFSA